MKDATNPDSLEDLLERKLANTPGHQRRLREAAARGLSFEVPDTTGEDIERLLGRHARNVERSVLWHLLHALGNPAVLELSLPSTLVPPENRLGLQSAQVLSDYASARALAIRPTARLAKIAHRLTRHKSPGEIKQAILEIPEMGHALQVKCLTREAYLAAVDTPSL